MTEDLIAIVPAGGRSRRFGRLVGPGGKAALEVGGESMLVRVCDRLSRERARVIVVAAEGQPLPPLPERVEVIRDREPFAGPVAAIHEGLVHAGGATRLALLVAGDLPSIEPAVLWLLVAAAREPGIRWAVPVVAGHPQVLLSAISTDLAAAFAAARAAGQASPRAVLAALAGAEPAAVRWIAEPELVAADPTLGSFLDIDTPEDLERLA
jgi:molybdenum cofactor guanylyltransferase